jgi:hypothetical protein
MVSQYTVFPSPDPDNPAWIRNKSKYMLITSADSDMEVLLTSAKYKPHNELPEDATIIAIQLAANQVVIIPFHMLYAVVNKDQKEYNVLSVHDFVTKFVP